jgi:hypothetical protein
MPGDEEVLHVRLGRQQRPTSGDQSAIKVKEKPSGVFCRSGRHSQTPDELGTTMHAKGTSLSRTMKKALGNPLFNALQQSSSSSH